MHLRQLDHPSVRELAELRTLVLDTGEGSVAEGAYEPIGFSQLGTIPRFSASPHDPAGTPRGATFFYREP